GPEPGPSEVRAVAGSGWRRMTFVRRLALLLSLVAAAAAPKVPAGDQSVQLQNTRPTSPLESPPGETFLERFTVAFDRHVDEVFLDRFHPFNVMAWNIELADNGSDHLRDRAASAARNALSKSVVYGVREATIDLPILLWLQDRQGLLADFLRNSLDNVGEEAVSPLDVDR